MSTHGAQCEMQLVRSAQRAVQLPEPGCKLFSKNFQRFPHLRFDCLYRYPQRNRNLRVFESVRTAQLEYFPAPVRESVDCAAYGNAHFIFDYVRVRRGIDSFRSRSIRLTLFCNSLMSHMIQ